MDVMPGNKDELVVGVVAEHEPKRNAWTNCLGILPFVDTEAPVRHRMGLVKFERL